jgi:hypothetical protein
MSLISSIGALAAPSFSLFDRLDRAALNPQPLPPKDAFGGSFVSQLIDDFCGTVPKRLPPPPPPTPLGGGLLDSAHVSSVIDALRLRF